MGGAREVVGFWAVSSLLLLGAGLAAGQECDPDTKVAFDPPVEASDMASLMQVEVPASCDDFQVAELIVCQEDIGFEEGCCEQACTEMLTKIDAACFGDFIQAACDSSMEKSIKILDNLARRCNEEYVPLACSADKVDTPVTAEEPTEATEANEAPANFFGQASDPPTEPEAPSANFFGQASDTPTEPEASSTNFFGQASDPSAEPTVEAEADATPEKGKGKGKAVPAEACDEETVLAEEEVDTNQLLPLAKIVPPKSCGDFQITSLLSCTEEINIVKGCCQESCKAVIEPIPKECFDDLVPLICASESADSLPILLRIIGRCHNDPYEMTCSELGPLDPAGKASDEETVEGLDSGTKPADNPKGSGTCAGEVDVNADIGKITQIITSVDSQRCPDLLKSDIIKCQADITTLDAENGCCEPDCKEFIGSLSEDCFSEIAMRTCAQDPDIHHIFQRTAARCLDTYKNRSCLGVKGGAGQQSTFTWAVLGSLLLIGMLVF